MSQILVNELNSVEWRRLGVSPGTIGILENAVRRGSRIADIEALRRLGVPEEDLKIIREHGAFAPAGDRPEWKRFFLKVQPAPLVDYLALARFTELSNRRMVTSTFPIGRDGTAQIVWNPEAVSPKFEVSVKTPSGRLASIVENGDKTPSVTIDGAATDKAVIEIVTETSVTIVAPSEANLPVQINGRLISARPKRNLEDVEVTIFVTLAKEPKPEDFFPILSTRTTANGYFLLPYPVEAAYQELTAARARVAFETGAEIAIRLDQQADELTGRLPERMILYLESDQTTAGGDGTSEGCGCDSLDMYRTRPLEEFSFYTVVRTTEPQIQPLVVTDTEEIPLGKLIGDKAVAAKYGDAVVSKDVAASFLNTNALIDATNVDKLLQFNSRSKLAAVLRGRQPKPHGRVELNDATAIDWDEEPTIYQATTIAHGHLLLFKQEWFNDGYSTGDVLYSLPLAPGQQKQIVVFDWDRRESASQAQELSYQESLNSSLGRDRDINEVVQATLTEELEASSEATTWAWGAGGGAGVGAFIEVVALGGLVGAAGGMSGASSSASQTGRRNTSAASEQRLRDRTMQSANAVRSQRATVVQSVSQGERFETSAELVANYNHCHAITIQYFEVLRHFTIRQRLADAVECLFVPLRMSRFEIEKALRWRDVLSRYLKRRNLVRGFAALQRLNTQYEGSELPGGMFAEEALEYLDGDLTLEIHLTRPRNDEADEFVETHWDHLTPLLGDPREFYERHLRNEAAKDEAFARAAGRKLAEYVVDRLEFRVYRGSQTIQLPGGGGIGTSPVPKVLPIDASLMSDFRNRQAHFVSLRPRGPLNIRRDEIETIEIGFKPSDSSQALLQEILERNLRIMVRRGSMRYRTKNLSEYLFRESHIDNDLTFDGDLVRIYAPLNRMETRNPRKEDLENARELLDHLNEHIEYYHKLIWMRMSPERRFMLLDGIRLGGKAEGRSVASVVENKVIGIVGNCLVMPVAPGFQLDPTIEGTDLFAHYYRPPADPIRFSLPTKGVFAEAVMGKCNSCEQKDDTRFWRWEESPIPDSPTAINAINPPTPAAQTPSLPIKDFPSPIVAFQNVPAAPDPQGLSAALQLLSNPNLFRDITGLTENQKNALAALQRAFQSAEFFGGQAAGLANMAAQNIGPMVAKAKVLDQIMQAKKDGLIDNDQSKELAEKYFESQLGESGSSVSQSTSEIVKIEQMEREGLISQSEAEKLLKILQEREQIHNENSRETIERESIKEVIKESTEVTVEKPTGEKTTVKRQPKAVPRDVTFLVTLKDTYGVVLGEEVFGDSDLTVRVVGGNIDEASDLRYSGAQFGTVITGLKLGNGSVEVIVEEDGLRSFAGQGALRLPPESETVIIQARMEFQLVTMTFSDSETISETISTQLSAKMGSKLTGGLKASISKVLEANVGGEVSAELAAARTNTDGSSSSQAVSVNFQVRIPTGSLELTIAT